MNLAATERALHTRKIQELNLGLFVVDDARNARQCGKLIRSIFGFGIGNRREECRLTHTAGGEERAAQRSSSQPLSTVLYVFTSWGRWEHSQGRCLVRKMVKVLPREPNHGHASIPKFLDVKALSWPWSA